MTEDILGTQIKVIESLTKNIFPNLVHDTKNARHAAMLNIIYKMCWDSGAVYVKPSSNKNGYFLSKWHNPVIVCCCGWPCYLIIDSSFYTISVDGPGSTLKFMTLLEEQFNVTVLSEERNEHSMKKFDIFGEAFTIRESGPILILDI